MKYTAKHYAEALRASCGNADTLRHVITDLANVTEHFAADPSVRAFFVSRVIASAQQEKILRDVFRDFLSQQTYAFLKTLIAHRQCALLERIIVHADRLADREEGTARVSIESAVAIGEATRNRIETILTQKLQRRILATYRTEADVIAGFRLTIDGVTEWDGTIAGQLHRLHARIRAATA